MADFLERYFKLGDHNTNVQTECIAGTATFLTMAYIIVVQPAVLSGAITGAKPTGMSFEAVTVATCLSAALATMIMGLYAKYPIAQAPGMGENFLFLFGLVPAAGIIAAKAGDTTGWQISLGVMFVSGILFLILSIIGIRDAVVASISPSMKHATAVGIGIFIALIGLKNSGVVVSNPGTYIELTKKFLSPDIIIFLFGIILITALMTRRVRGAILIGILSSTVLAVLIRYGAPGWATGSQLERLTLDWHIASLPPSIAPTAFKLDLRFVFNASMIPFIFMFLFMDVFDTIGTLIGVGSQAGLLKDGKLIAGRKAMISDAIGTVAGACLGTSTVTSFIESSAGVKEGGRTGLTAVVTAFWFIAALFFVPLVKMLAGYPPITGCALVAVGAMMIRNVREIEFDDPSELIPAFMTMIGIPLFFSIADGLAIGFIMYPITKLLSGRRKDVKTLSYVMMAVLLLYFLLVREPTLFNWIRSCLGAARS